MPRDIDPAENEARESHSLAVGEERVLRENALTNCAREHLNFYSTLTSMRTKSLTDQHKILKHGTDIGELILDFLKDLNTDFYTDDSDIYSHRVSNEIDDCTKFTKAASDFIRAIHSATNLNNTKEQKQIHIEQLNVAEQAFLEHTKIMYNKFAPGIASKFIGAVMMFIGTILTIGTVGFAYPMVSKGYDTFFGKNANKFNDFKNTLDNYKNQGNTHRLSPSNRKAD